MARCTALVAIGSIGLALLAFAPAFSQSADPLPRRGFLGAVLANDRGIHVASVLPGSAAAAAGIRAGDAVTAVDGAPVASNAEFLKALHLPAGSVVSIALTRSGTAVTVSAILQAAPTEQDPAVDTLYRSVEVDGTLRRVLITVPHGARGPFPSVMIVGGIGCFSIDNTNPQDAYRNVAHDLSRRGFAVVRLEKSGIGDSQGPPCSNVDFATEMHSYDVTLQWLSNNPLLDASRIYLLGHSIGGVIAPRLAAARNVAGVIVAESVGINWFEYELINMRRQLVLSGTDAATVDANMKTFARCLTSLEIEGASYADIVHEHADCASFMAIYPVPAAYMKEVADLNVAQPWTSLDVPVLAVYGSSDFITDESDHQHIVDIVNAAHQGSATLAVVDHMDHYLTVVDTQKESQDRAGRRAFGPYDRDFSSTVGDWLCKRVRCS